MSDSPLISISVVSHGQAALVDLLLRDLATHLKTPVEVVLTINIPEGLPFDPISLTFPVRILSNLHPKGFGANHNAAFRESGCRYFCVLNPDIRFESDPFPALIDCLSDPTTGVAAPLIRDPAGSIEDNARFFPTPWTILRKALIGSRLDYAAGTDITYPDWVAGMFMLFTREVFAEIGGFDERYFLYYEDVDLCARLSATGRWAAICPQACAVHAARRESRRSLRYLRWHISSMLRFFLHRSAAIRRTPRTAGRGVGTTDGRS